MPQDKGGGSGGGRRKDRLEDTAKPGAMQKILDEMDAEIKPQRRSKSKGGTEVDKDDKDKDRDRRRERDDRVVEQRDDKERRDRDKDQRDRRDKDKDVERRDREGKHRDDKDREGRHRSDKDRESRHKEDKDRESRHKEDKDRESRHKDGKDRESRHNDDKDRESKQRDDKDRERRHRDDKDRDRQRDDKDRERKRGDKDRDKVRDEKDQEGRHRDDKTRERHRDEDKDRRDKDRDRRDRDENRERRDKDKDRERDRDRPDKEKEKDKDRDRRDKDKDQKSGAASSLPAHTNGKAEDAVAEDDDYKYDEEQFDNYDEDFDEDANNEDKDEDEVEPQQPPRKGESDDRRKVDAKRGIREDSDSDRDSRGQQQQQPRPKAFIDFFGAKRRQATTAAASRTQRRWDELSRLIDLDKVSYDLFQLAPLEEYALYMRQYGRTNAHQAAVQTNEDAVDREAMTDEIEYATRWTQNPPAEMECAGLAPATASGVPAEDDTGGGGRKKRGKPAAEAPPQPPPPSSKSLLRTLELVRRVLEEQSRPRVANSRREAAGHLSSGFTPLTPAEHYGPASRLVFDPRRSATLLSVHPHAAALLLWNAHEPDRPLCALAAPAGVSSVCWTPDGLVCAGLEDGALCLWDPAETAESHGRYDPEGVSLRGPTYSTAWLPAANHLAGGVVGLAPVGRALHSGGAYQVVSMDPSGRVHAWVASATTAAGGPGAGFAEPAGSASDLGLRPGGRVGLTRSSARADLPAWCGAPLCLAGGGEAAIVGTADGSLVRLLAGGGGRRVQALGRPQPAGVTALDVSPHQRPGLLLAGHADGAVRLFASASTAGCQSPLLELQPRPDAIRRVLWSRSRPGVFFTLDSAGRLLVYDLVQKVTGPVSVFAEQGVVDFALGEDFHSTGRGSKSDRAVCGLCRVGGEVEVHTLAESLSSPELDEGFRVSQLVDRLFA